MLVGVFTLVLPRRTVRDYLAFESRAHAENVRRKVVGRVRCVYGTGLTLSIAAVAVRWES